MAYSSFVEFIETRDFERHRESYLNDDEFAALQFWLMAYPEAGDIMKGSGGVRKIRWKAKGKGKRGGLRVIYFLKSKDDEIFLLSIFHKSEVSDLTKDEIRALKKLVKEL